MNTTDTGPLTQVSALFAGGNDSLCAIVGGAANLDCWGDGPYGGLGDGADNDSDIPVEVHGFGNSGFLSGVTSAVGDGSTWCAVLSSGGNVACWGSGSADDLGIGTGGSSDYPVEVNSPNGVATDHLGGASSLTTDSYGSCAVLGTGDGIDCWGFNYFGVLGNASDTGGSLIPEPVFGLDGGGTLSGAKSVTGAQADDRDSRCAVLTDNQAVCWGLGVDGELGGGSAGLSTFDYGDLCSTYPTPVVGTSGTGRLTDIKSILGNPVAAPRYAGSYCALLTPGGVDCWGFAPEGELGNGTLSSSFIPGPVFGAS